MLAETGAARESSDGGQLGAWRDLLEIHEQRKAALSLQKHALRFCFCS